MSVTVSPRLIAPGSDPDWIDTPVALFIGSRLETTTRVVKRVIEAGIRRLYVIQDGPRPDSPGDVDRCLAVRALLDTAAATHIVARNYAETNLGSDRRVASALDWLFGYCEEAIVLEDGWLPEPSFFAFASELLARYRGDNRVFGISGTNVLFGQPRGSHSYYFSRQAGIGGWATWRRTWRMYKQDTTLASWKADHVHAIPNVNLVSYIGCEPAAIRAATPVVPYCDLSTAPIVFPLRHPQDVVEDETPQRVEVTQKHPDWSVMIPVRNCSAELRETLASVLAQDRGSRRMHIEVVDDASDDDPASVVRAMAGRRVDVFRQATHAGLVGNLNTCLQRAKGRWVHILHGDDWVRPGFYEAMEGLFARHPEIGAAFCGVTYFDVPRRRVSTAPVLQTEPGVLADALERIFLDNPLTTAGVVVKRETYAEVGGFDSRLTCCAEDWEMWIRIALRWPIGYHPEPFAVYRLMREGSVSLSNLRSGAFGADMQLAHRIVRSRLMQARPGAGARALDWRAREGTALYMLDALVPLLRRSGHEWAALGYVARALRCRPSLRVVLKALSTVANWRRDAAVANTSSVTQSSSSMTADRANGGCDLIKYGRGFFSPERDSNGLTWRWMSDVGTVFVRRTSRKSKVRLVASAPIDKAVVRVDVDGEKVDEFVVDIGDFERDLPIPAGCRNHDIPLELRIATNGVVATERDRRRLGLRVFRIDCHDE